MPRRSERKPAVMRKERVQRLANAQVAQWSEYAATSTGRATDDGSSESTAGAYWPLGSAHPGVSALSAQIEVISVWAEDQTLGLNVRPGDSDEIVPVLIDLAPVSDEEGDDLIQTLIFARVAELVASDRWIRRHGIASPFLLTI